MKSNALVIRYTLNLLFNYLNTKAKINLVNDHRMKARVQNNSFHIKQWDVTTILGNPQHFIFYCLFLAIKCLKHGICRLL
jgi:hypothetical protein